MQLGYKLDNQKLACIGKGTARALKAHTNKIAFIGDNVDIQVTAQQFAELAGNETCLFPISNISSRTIQKAFKNQSLTHDLVVYNTQENKVSVPAQDVLVFTSPSNVRSYFSNHQDIVNEKIIAIGPSTGKELTAYKVNRFDIPAAQGELGLIDLISSLML